MLRGACMGSNQLKPLQQDEVEAKSPDENLGRFCLATPGHIKVVVCESLDWPLTTEKCPLDFNEWSKDWSRS